MHDLESDARLVRRIAHDTLGPGAEPKRAARDRRKVALLTILARASRGETPTPAEEAEYTAAHAAWWDLARTDRARQV